MKESNSNLSLHKWPFRDKMAQMHRMQDVLTRLNKFHNKGHILNYRSTIAARLMGLNDTRNTDEISARIYALGNENTIIHQRCNNDDA